MENMENVVMETNTEIPAEVTESSLGEKIFGGLIIGGVVAGAVALGRKVYDKIKDKINAKKAKDEAVVDEYEDVTCEEE